MKISIVLATGILTLILSTGGTTAQDPVGLPNFQQIVATMNNVEWTVHEIGLIRNVADVRLVQLDDSMGADEQAFIGILAKQRGTAEIDALRAAVAGNQKLMTALERQHIAFRNIIAIDIGDSGTITVYTFGASA
jgi:hypothetical protein